MPIDEAAATMKRSANRLRSQIRNGQLERGSHFRRMAAGGIEVNVDAYLEWLTEQYPRRTPLVERIRHDSKQKTQTQIQAPASRTAPAPAGGNEQGKRLPKLIPISVWAEILFGEHAPHKNTLHNWRKNGRIYPNPIKCGGRYFVEPHAVYVDDAGEMQRRLWDRR